MGGRRSLTVIGAGTHHPASTQPDVYLRGVCTAMAKTQEIERLYRKHYRRVVAALSLTYGPEDAADAVQEAFIQADRKWRRIRTYEDHGAWLARVAINRARNRKRDSLRRAEILQNSVNGSRAEGTDLEALLDLRRAIELLPPQMRLSVGLFYLADLPIDAVAHVLGVAPGTVKSNLYDARQTLKQLLSEGTHG